MKLFCSVLAIICFAQICLCAPASDASSESDEYLTDDKIDALQLRLKAVPSMDSKAVDDFIQILRKFRKDVPEKEQIAAALDLMSLALQGPTCDKRKIDLRPILESTDSSNSDEGTSEGITEKEMREAQEELSKLVSGEQVQHAMIILRGLRVGATEEEKHASILDLYTSAIKALKTECAAH